jgi:two-component system CheB/CheR fusion protein
MAAKKADKKKAKSRIPKTKKPTAKSERIPKAAASRKEARPSHIVGMGASAGGLEAFEQFFSNLKSKSGMAFILVPHLDPTHTSIMPELIQKATKMKVFQVEDGILVEPDTVYIIPPNSHMALLNGALQLIEPMESTAPRMSIDHFFRSLAQDQRERAICVILSGMGSDGSLGLKAIKEELGMAMVQDVESAKYEGMPRSAIQTGLVDYVLPPAEMPAQLIKYSKHVKEKIPLKITPDAKDTPNALQKIFILLRSTTGHDFSHYKQNTICRRIERRMNVQHIENVSQYVRYLQQNPDETRTLFKELLIGVTNFFRDGEAFEVLKQEALLKLLSNKPEVEPVRVWVPGCSTGEEAYSVAIVLRECMDDLNRYADIQIFATDIDEEAIDAARTAVYPNSISVDVNKTRLKRFFMKEDSFYRINKEIRDVLIFAPQNIIKDPPFTKLDLICCRNLLIYLDTDLQRKLLPLFHYSLRPGGILFLGSSETIGGFRDLFAVVDKKWKVYRRKETSSSFQLAVEFPLTMPIAAQLDDREVGVAKPLSISQVAERSLLDKYAPPSAVINDAGDILYIHGRTGRYLEPAPGEAKLNIYEMAREGLKLELPFAVRRSINQQGKVICEGLRVVVNGEVCSVNLTIRPMRDSEAEGGLLMVVFEELPPPARKTRAKKKAAPGKAPDKRIEGLERELQHLKESHQITIEKLETANEELKSINEELQSTNEELQSANEELETSREELQSLNEELITVNTELESKNEELSRANNDMKNLLDSIEVPTIFVDNELRIKSFTSHAPKVVKLLPMDVGRPITDIASNLNYEGFGPDISEVLETLALKETDVKTTDGRWYVMRILPYRTVENVIDGVAITFLDVDELRRTQLAHQEACEFAESVVHTVREPLVVLNADLRVVSANSSFYHSFQATPKETEGELIYDLYNRQWDIAELRTLLEEIVPEKRVIADFEIESNFEKIGRRRMLLHAREIYHQGVGTKKILLTIEDVTDKKPS